MLTWAKFLEGRPDYDYVFSGSLLSIDHFDIRSWSVGFLDELTMFPLTFVEFARACGTAASIVDIARESVDRREAVPDFAHEKLMELHSRYLLVGGLPGPLQRTPTRTIWSPCAGCTSPCLTIACTILRDRWTTKIFDSPRPCTSRYPGS